MSTYTLLDPTGEPVSTLTGNLDQLLLNVPPGHSLLDVPPPGPSAWWSAEGSTWVTKPAPPSGHHEWDKVGKAWVDGRSLAEAKEAKWESLKEHREALKSSGYFTALGYVFDSNPVMVNGAVSAAMLAGSAFQTTWTLADNSSIVITSPTQMAAVGMAQMAYVDGLYGTARALRGALEAATALAEVDAIQWP